MVVQNRTAVAKVYLRQAGARGRGRGLCDLWWVDTAQGGRSQREAHFEGPVG